MRRYIAPLIFGLAGLAVLLSLGMWQVRRLAWKTELIASIEARIHDAPVALPAQPDVERDRYMPVTIEGSYPGASVHVLATERGIGTGTRVISVLETTDGRRVLVDRGFLPDAARAGAEFAASQALVTGNLIWPRDSDSFTPQPDLTRGLWFSRDIPPIARHLESEEVMIVARTDSARVAGLSPRPINSADVRNDHLGYAATWFLLAAVWAGMTAYFLWRIRRNTA